MDFKRIRQFILVAEIGNLSQAAERLNMVQPALSQSIKRLEQDLDTTLFLRSRKGMQLTSAGEVFLKHAQGIVNQYSRAKEDLANVEQKPSGQVSIGMTSSIANVISLPISRSIRTQFPDISLNVESGLAGNIQHGFESGWYDLVVTYKTERKLSVETEELIEEELFLASSSLNSNSSENEIEFSKLEHLEMIVPQEHHGVEDSISQPGFKSSLKINRAPITATLNPTLQMIEAGIGHSILPWTAIHNLVSEKKVLARKIVNPSISRTVCMMYPSSRPMTRASLAVKSIIKTAIIESNEEKIWPGKLLPDCHR